MRSLTIGGGAVGQYLAARLVEGGHDVVIMARPGQAEAINARGVSLRVNGKTSTLRPRAAADIGDASLREPFELVVVAVKSYSTSEAVRTIGDIAACRGASILTVQNGLGNEEALAEAFGAERVIAGALTVAVDRLDATSIAATSKGGLSISPVGRIAHNWVIAAISKSGLAVRAVASWQALKWSKLCINLLGNGVCAALDWLPEQVYSDAAAFSVERACLMEAIAVMSKLDIAALNLVNFPAALLVGSAQTLPASVLRVVLANRVMRARGGKLPSLLMDLRAHRAHSEVTALNGGVALAAIRLGMAAPANSKVTEVISGVAAGTVAWDEYRGRPQKLLAIS